MICPECHRPPTRIHHSECSRYPAPVESPFVYLSGKLTPSLVRGIGRLGQMITPASYRAAAFMPALPYAVDTGCFAQPDAFRLGAYLSFLHELAAEHGPALFATAPDRFGDGSATLRQSLGALDEIRDTGHPAALVLQPGMDRGVPWRDVDAVFLGGPDAWQTSDEALRIVRAAQERGKYTHKGRVNTRARLLAARAWGFDSADGTFLAFGPDQNLPRLLGWINEAASSAPLEGMA